MFSYDSQREGSTFGHGDATRGFQFGALYCGAAAAKSSTSDTDLQPPGGGSGHTDPPPDAP